MISIRDMQSKLQGNVVKQICSTYGAFAAIQDGSVVTWGGGALKRVEIAAQ
jgi:hypothetical protein